MVFEHCLGFPVGKTQTGLIAQPLRLAGLQHEKTCIWGFRPGPAQTGLYTEDSIIYLANLHAKSIFSHDVARL